MSRYIGPLWRKSRALGISLLGNKKEFSRGKKRTTIPGQHGNNTRKRRRVSNYALQLKEVQKLRFLYGLTAAQLRNLFVKLMNKRGDFSYNLLLDLESRLDNIIFRSGVGTRRFARQLINHGHFLVNGKKVNIPSYRIKVNEVIEISEKIINNEKVRFFLKEKKEIPNYINFEEKRVKISLNRTPLMEEIKNPDISIPLVIEWFNKKI